MKKNVQYWTITPERKVSCEKLYDYVKNNLTITEAKLIWYLRNMPCGTTFSFYNTAKKLFNAYQAKADLENIPD